MPSLIESKKSDAFLASQPKKPFGDSRSPRSRSRAASSSPLRRSVSASWSPTSMCPVASRSPLARSRPMSVAAVRISPSALVRARSTACLWPWVQSTRCSCTSRRARRRSDAWSAAPVRTRSAISDWDFARSSAALAFCSRCFATMSAFAVPAAVRSSSPRCSRAIVESALGPVGAGPPFAAGAAAAGTGLAPRGAPGASGAEETEAARSVSGGTCG